MNKTQEQLDHELDGTRARPVAPPNDAATQHPKQKEALDVFSRLQASRRMGISVDISKIAGALKLAEPRATFPEVLFVEHFLPIFAGEKPATPEVNLRTWVEKVAGGELVPVDVVNENGDVLFTVPPMFDMSVIEQVKPGDVSMTHIERHYSRLKEIDAVASQQFISKKLQGMHIKDKPTQQVYDNMRTWNQIFERYGKADKIINLLDLNNDPSPNKEAVVSSPGASPAAGVGEYSLDYD